MTDAFTQDCIIRQRELHVSDPFILNMSFILCIFCQINVLVQGLHSAGTEFFCSHVGKLTSHGEISHLSSVNE